MRVQPARQFMCLFMKTKGTQKIRIHISNYINSPLGVVCSLTSELLNRYDTAPQRHTYGERTAGMQIHKITSISY